jgi:hypothetical protein
MPLKQQKLQQEQAFLPFSRLATATAPTMFSAGLLSSALCSKAHDNSNMQPMKWAVQQ